MIAFTGIVVAAPLGASLVARFVPGDGARRNVRIVLALAAALAVAPALAQLDSLSRVYAIIVSVLGALATVFSAGAFSQAWAKAEAPWSERPAYFVLLGAFWSSMLLVAVGTNFVALWLGIACTTFATAFLVGFAGDATALEAAWKYLMVCGVGMVAAFVGILLIGHAAIEGGVSPNDALAWDSLASHPLSPTLFRLGAALALTGFATKAGLSPMHAWLPDAHSKAPAPVSALLSGVLVSCALYGIMRIEQVAIAQGAFGAMSSLLLTFGALSTVLAGALMLAQRDLKRLLAYSTVEHMGIVALALGFGGPLGFLAALIHVVNHAFAKTIGFFAAGAIQQERGTTRIASLQGLQSSGAGGLFFAGAAIALAGLPPFGLFASEVLVVLAGVQAHQWIPLSLGLLGIVLGVAALARATIDIESGPAPQSPSHGISRLAVGAGIASLAGLAFVSLLPWLPIAALRDAAAVVGLPK